MNRLARAVAYNTNLGHEYSLCGSIKDSSWTKLIPVVKGKSHVEVQTTCIPMGFMNRLCYLLNGPHAALFYRIIDILIDGYGCVKSDNVLFEFDQSGTLKK